MLVFRDLVVVLALVGSIAAAPLAAGCGGCRTSTQSHASLGALHVRAGDGVRFASAAISPAGSRVEHDTITVTATLTSDVGADGAAEDAGGGESARETREVMIVIPATVGQTGTFPIAPDKTSACITASPG